MTLFSCIDIFLAGSVQLLFKEEKKKAPKIQEAIDLVR